MSNLSLASLNTSKVSSTDVQRKLVAQGTAPTSPTPVAGDLWYDTGNNILKYYDGSNWQGINTYA
jgi:hypothetical protein